MGTEEPRDDAFIVRIWREEGEPGWRGSVQQVHTGRSFPFASLDRLLAFLEQQIDKLTGRERKGLK